MTKFLIAHVAGVSGLALAIGFAMAGNYPAAASSLVAGLAGFGLNLPTAVVKAAEDLAHSQVHTAELREGMLVRSSADYALVACLDHDMPVSIRCPDSGQLLAVVQPVSQFRAQPTAGWGKVMVPGSPPADSGPGPNKVTIHPPGDGHDYRLGDTGR